MTKNSIEIFKTGSQVKLAEDVYGIITAVCIRANNYVTYECAWWNGRSHDSKWFHSDEIEVTLAEKTRIGFV